ncbi:MAG: glycosyltransferase [Cyanothece sp. SIO1E1]|nr:glycosyltransferase [Cyanothece sp. SIO1E1]
MHIVILFHNIGGYHAARLRAAQAACQERGWRLTAIQETDSAHEHPWGDLAQEITFPLKTLLSAQAVPNEADRHPQATLAARRLPTCLKTLNPDVLAIPGWGYPISRAALRFAKHHRLPAILMSESKWDDTPRTWWKEMVKSLFYTRQFQSALVGGKLHRDYLVRLGFPATSISFGYDIVDNDYFTQQAQSARRHSSAIRQQHKQLPDRPYFIAVTRFIPRKNVLRLIDAFAQYRQAISQEQAWDLVICGSGEEEANIRDRIHSYHLEPHIHLPGFQSYQAIPYWFGLASAFIHPAVSEQWGLVVNEALAAGLPALVSNRCGCYPELILEGINGFGFDPENVEQLSYLMVKISHLDTVELQQMGAAALNHIQQFSPMTFGQGIVQTIQYACAENSK